MSLTLSELEQLTARTRLSAERLLYAEGRREAAALEFGELARLEIEYALQLAGPLRERALGRASAAMREAVRVAEELPPGHRDPAPAPDARSDTKRLVDDLEILGQHEAAEAVRTARYYTAIRTLLGSIRGARQEDAAPTEPLPT